MNTFQEANVPATGKILGLRHYLHSDAIPTASTELRDLITRAQLFGGINDHEFNVVRSNLYASHVSFLMYPHFFEEPFPALQSASAVDLARSSLSRRSYQDSLNPPILHRKELLLPTNHPARQQFQALTDSLERLGIFQTDVPIGFRRQWNELLANAGYSVDGHTLVPIANTVAVEEAGDSSNITYSADKPIARYLTALS